MQIYLRNAENTHQPLSTKIKQVKFFFPSTSFQTSTSLNQPHFRSVVHSISDLRGTAIEQLGRFPTIYSTYCTQYTGVIVCHSHVSKNRLQWHWIGLGYHISRLRSGSKSLELQPWTSTPMRLRSSFMNIYDTSAKNSFYSISISINFCTRFCDAALQCWWLQVWQ